MDLSQPVTVVLAFVAGFGFLLCTRLVWSLLTHSFYLMMFVGALILLGQNGVLHLDELKNSAAGRFVQSGAHILLTTGAGMKDWISGHEIKVHIAKRQRLEEK